MTHAAKDSLKINRGKIFLSLGIIMASVIYAVSKGGNSASLAVGNPVALPSQNQGSSPKAKSGIYIDGVYQGSPADAYYGPVQVKTTIQNGRIVNVEFLQYPADRNTSASINSRAMAILKSEAIKKQSANVDIVSGATDTSMAFQQSLASTLTKLTG